MNKRIRELERQATETVRCGLNGTSTAESFNRKKFAELLIRECVKQVEPTQHHEVWAQSYLGGVDGLDLLYSKINDIKKHFGIEQ